MLLSMKKRVRTGSRGRKRNRKISGFLQNTNNLKYTNKPSVVQKKLPKKNIVFIESRELFSFTNPVKVKRKFFYRPTKVFYHPKKVRCHRKLRHVVDLYRSIKFYRQTKFRRQVKIRRRFRLYCRVKLNLNYLVKKGRVATLRIELGFLRNKINRKHFFHSLKIFFITPKSVHAFFSLFKFFFTDGKLVLLKRPPTTYVHIFSFDNFSKVMYDRLAIHKYFWLYITFSLSKIFPISIRGVKNFKITIGTLATRFIKRWKEWGRGSFFYKRQQRRKFGQKSKFLNLPKFATKINYPNKPFPRIPKNFFGINGIKNLSFFKKLVNKLYLFSLFSGKINFKVLFSYMKLFRKLLKLNFSTLQFFTFFKSLLYFSALSRTSIGLIRFFFFIDFYIKRAFSSMETIISPFIPMFAYNCTVLKKFSVAVQKAIFLRKPYTKYYKHDDDEKFMVFRQAFLKKSLL